MLGKSGKYVDDDGEFPTIAVGAVIGGLIEGGCNLYDQVSEKGWSGVDVGELLIEITKGAAQGAAVGSGVGAIAVIGSAASEAIADYAEYKLCGKDMTLKEGIIDTIGAGISGLIGWGIGKAVDG